MKSNISRMFLAVLALAAACVLIIPGTLSKYTTQTSFTFRVVTDLIQPGFFGFNGAPYDGSEITDGSVQRYEAPNDGYYILQAWGADGGSSSAGDAGAAGTYQRDYIFLSAGQVLNVCVGGKGGNATAVSPGESGWPGSENQAAEPNGGDGGSTGIWLEGAEAGDCIVAANGGAGGGSALILPADTPAPADKIDPAILNELPDRSASTAVPSQEGFGYCIITYVGTEEPVEAIDVQADAAPKPNPSGRTSKNSGSSKAKPMEEKSTPPEEPVIKPDSVTEPSQDETSSQDVQPEDPALKPDGVMEPSEDETSD